MNERIIIRPGRELTDEEIKLFERKRIVFDTKSTSTQGHNDKFAGVSIPSRTIGVTDYISCLMCKVRKIESKESEYEIIFEETDSVEGLARENVGYKIAKYKMKPLEEQLRHLQDTDLAELLKDTSIIEQIEEKFKEENAYNEHSGYSQRERFWNETLDILSNMRLLDNAQIGEIGADGSRTCIIKDDKYNTYTLIKLPGKVKFRLSGNSGKFEFSDCVSSKEKVIEESREDFMKRIQKANTLYNLYYRYSPLERSLIMPEDVSSIEELNRVITEIEQIQLEKVDIDGLPIKEIHEILGGENIKYFFDDIIKKHDVEYVIKKFKDIDDNELKKTYMACFSKKDVNYTEEQSEKINGILIELLMDEKGWKDNANVIAGFAQNMSTLDYHEKIKILQLSIDAHNNYCAQDKFSKSMGEQECQKNQINMRLSGLINQLFTVEEQRSLVEELINQKDYQTMIMILKECEFDGKRVDSWRSSEGDKYSEISTEQKGIMVEELMKYKDDAPVGWLKSDKKTYRDVPYIIDYMADKEQSEEVTAIKGIMGKSPFAILDYDVEIPKGFIKCFDMAHICGVIDIEKAKTSTRNGKLHIDVPEPYMAMMIGKKGANIKSTQDKLKKELGLQEDVKIIMHPKIEKQEENPTKTGGKKYLITLDEIKEQMAKQKKKEEINEEG